MMVQIKLARNSAGVLSSLGQLKWRGERISSYSYSIEGAAMCGVAMTLVKHRTLVLSY
jgi:hypothetical protein